MKKRYPDTNGHFKVFGGRYVGEILMPALLQLEKAFYKYIKEQSFLDKLDKLFKDYVGRPTPLYHAKRLSNELQGAQIYLKREDLAHTGAHKINNTLGQVLLAQHMNKNDVIAETGAGQHGVATATTAALFGMGCKVFMGVEDIRRQKPNVERMQLLGAKVIPVDSGTGTLKDAMNEAMRYWAEKIETTFYVIGSVAGPHPYPEMVREFQKIIGIETRAQIMKMVQKLPDTLIACVGGGSNAIGFFYEFLDEKNIEMIGVEAAGKGVNTDKHAATLCKGSVGVLHGSKSYVLQDKSGQIKEAHSISAGLDYPGVGPEHSMLKETKRVNYVSITDKQALKAFDMLCTYEGIIPALESSHALAFAIKEAKKRSAKDIIIVNLSGRGDKDLKTIKAFLQKSL